MTTIDFDKKVICNDEYVAVRIIENCEDLKVGNLYLTSNANANDRLAFARLEDVGAKAKEEYGLEVGQYVMIDRLATFAHTAPVALLKYNNVICLTNEMNDEFHPLKGMLFAEMEEKDDISNINGFYLPNAEQKLNTATITDLNLTCESKDKFKIGDKILLVKGGDVLELPNRKINIFKQDMLICMIKD